MKSDHIKPPRALVWSSLLVFTIAFIFIGVASKQGFAKGQEIQTKGQPTIGYPNAKVHVVVFEEPKCIACKEYSLEVFPKIKKEFIDTNKILYTQVVVSFLPGSMPAAIALLCVYNSDPEFPNDDLYFDYFEYIYKHQPPEDTDWATDALLVDYAKNTSKAIDLSKLKSCIDKAEWRNQVEKNTAFAKEVMNGNLSTPNVYVNGYQVRDLSYENLSHIIKEALKSEGIY